MRRLPLLLRILIWLILLGIIVYLLLFGMVLYKESHVPAPGDDYEAVVVLGAQVKPDGTPNLQLQWRLDAGLEAYRKHPCFIVVCGAQGSDEPMPEAVAMRRVLEDAGVPPEQILSDPSSFNTRQNLQNARALLEPYGIRKIIIVTSNYHLPRALALASDLGFDATGLASPTLGGFFWLKNHARETLSWVKYFLESRLHIEI
ncbi:MAG: YdcF family protein [Clostridia bacterium]|nr:YdcF family protein [Clostridia bacterium]